MASSRPSGSALCSSVVPSAVTRSVMRARRAAAARVGTAPAAEGAPPRGGGRARVEGRPPVVGEQRAQRLADGDRAAVVDGGAEPPRRGGRRAEQVVGEL